MLTSVVEQLVHIYNANDDVRSRILAASNVRDLSGIFHELLSKATAAAPLYLILDSLDQLSEQDHGRLMRWLPTKVPDHVRIVVSTLPESKYECFPALQEKYGSKAEYVEVAALTKVCA